MAGLAQITLIAPVGFVFARFMSLLCLLQPPKAPKYVAFYCESSGCLYIESALIPDLDGSGDIGQTRTKNPGTAAYYD